MTLLGSPTLLGTETGVVLATTAALPLVVLCAIALAGRRIHLGMPRGRAWRTSLTEVGMVYGTVPGVWMTMLPGMRAGEVDGAVSLVPLRDLPTMSTFQVVGNLLIFAAFGLLAPWRWPALASVPRVVAVAALASGTVETAQYVFRLDRVSSIDDVLLNASGAGLACAVSIVVLGVGRLAAAVSRRHRRGAVTAIRATCPPAGTRTYP
ncbi:VanZ like family protein [Pedococcus dokdonensis]|uniref:VanZ like family protein n=1 Tax=Pedococcus dokdonensis TaxID=443156 RepID=A0A1H0MX77_9MICO|nr:VanZ family protein [Pedococcus dokdonensis]SDO85007.1 VanZ like family protein [Pedococcus dokdonensis]